MKILAAVDGSEASMHAAKTGLMLASNTAGEVTLIHVTSPFTLTSDFGAMMPDPAIELQNAGEALLAHALQTLGAPPTTAVVNRVGAVAEVISDFAAEGEFDLVVAGHTGRGAVVRMLVGSVADRLVHICSKPVLVVR